ncbi:hypothetical protein GALMADRAFT_76620 [Galerina marginata CBS 339.88]|uniref:T6SS Phospholipase effector Tle1-like catalytic domain-containing protein n=1 Tax=Galerina marginata (strain CBS 339.88) TaxID=685588 RepID=A0A067SIZ7_GALM3|nr:hypothetical protein GALMADRAFT_76620 [Galerina marginata CBS 339.88]
MQPVIVKENLLPRTIVLCFDGTGNKFGENSNVVRLFRALVKDKPDEQIVYYQPGVGTYNQRQFFTQTVSGLASALDKGVALHLNDHVKEGYQFIMRNYRRGDKICLFGFSRGAHTARVVAGMLYKVGLLPAHNDQQLDFAFSVYQTTGSHGVELSKEFKKTFAIPVTVEFVGVWDTVSSVGIIPRSHPYTSVNYAVKTFRHALALDERRARFRPQTWNEPTVEREQDLDVDDPHLIMIKKPSDKSRDEWEYQPPDRTTTDVKEVWFTGAHADVGGGSHKNDVQESLSYIPLRWMIKECLLAGTGVLFDQRALSLIDYFGSPSLSLSSFPSFFSALQPANIGFVSIPSNAILEIQNLFGHNHPLLNLAIKHAKDATDCVAKVWDQLQMQRAWWALEVLPMLTTYQRPDGVWVRKRVRNFGQGRYIPFSKNKVLVHISVQERINASTPEKPYRPAAFNWETVVGSGMLEYVS